jgi:hypothetical protein
MKEQIIVVLVSDSNEEEVPECPHVYGAKELRVLKEKLLIAVKCKNLSASTEEDLRESCSQRTAGSFQ